MVQFRNRTRTPRREGWGLPDPFATSSPGYAERAQQVVTRFPGGLTRVDLGEPVSRLEGEPRAVVVPADKPRLTPTPLTAPASPPQPPAPRIVAAEPDTKPGLGKRRR